MKVIERTDNAMGSRAAALACTAGLGCAVAALLFAATPLWAQSQARAGQHEAMPATARSQAPFDPSGYWVALITRNWRQRMVVNSRGDYADIPISRAAQQFADAWNPMADTAAGKQCEAYGAGIIMFLPERLHISWQDADVLRVDTDAGMQTRLLHFVPPDPMTGEAMERAQNAPPMPTEAQITPSMQGYSVARWVDLSRPVPGAPNAPRYGSIEATTDHMLPGLLRKNGVPYGSQAKMTEYWDLRTDDSGAQWLTISTTLQDPVYLQAPYVYDSVFQKEANGSRWDPAPCSLTS